MQGQGSMQGSPMGQQAPFNTSMMFNPGMVNGQNQMMQNMGGQQGQMVQNAGGGGSMLNVNPNMHAQQQGMQGVHNNTFAQFGGGSPGAQGFQGATFGNMANPNNGGSAGFGNSATGTLTGGAATQPGGTMGSSPLGMGGGEMRRF